MPGLLKIGRTERQPETRARELGTTGVPSPFKIEFSILVSDSVATEAIVHSSLEASGCRAHKAREFFEVSLGEAIDAIHAAVDASRESDGTRLGALHSSALFLDFPLPNGDQTVTDSEATALAERLTELARHGQIGALRRAAAIFLYNCPSALRFRQYTQEYLLALRDEAKSTIPFSATRFQDLGRIAGDYIIHLLERRWSVQGDFEFLVNLLSADQSVRTGFQEAVRSSRLPDALRSQILTL